ncbi:MAG TPA: hypothetical protein VEI96_04115 [Thermodesulfovibrionales bacterium]|nr:hypothetical protein [Thermodesulfovibrionales bacterium]
MGSSIVRFIIVVCFLIQGVLPLSAEWDTSPGMNSVFASRPGVTIPNCRGGEGTLLTATIKEGNAGSVLAVEVMMLFEKQIAPVTGPARITARPSVNGMFMEPSRELTHFSLSQQCPADITFCTISGIFWLDLDVAETIQPGKFIGKPLAVKLVGCDGSGGGAITHVTVKAQTVKK